MTTPYLHFDVVNQLGPLTLGAYFSTMIFGSTVLQLIHYYLTSPKDSRALKYLVAFTFLLDTCQLATILFANYQATIIHWGDSGIFGVTAVSNWFVRLLSGQVFASVVSIPTVQLFWLWRIRTIGNKTNWLNQRLTRIFIIGFLLLLIAAETASMSIFTFKSTVLALHPEQSEPYAIVALSIMAVTDSCLAVVMSLVLHRSRSGLRRTNTVLNVLIVYTLANGSLTTTFTLAVLILFLMNPLTWTWAGVFLIYERLYVSSMLASLNTRATLQKSMSESYVDFGEQNYVHKSRVLTQGNTHFDFNSMFEAEHNVTNDFRFA